MEAQPFFNDVATAYKGKVSFLGVMDANPRVVSKFRDDFSVPYPMACEETMKTFTNYQSLRSVYFTVITKNGEEVLELGATIDAEIVKRFPEQDRQLAGGWRNGSEAAAIHPEGVGCGTSRIGRRAPR